MGLNDWFAPEPLAIYDEAEAGHASKVRQQLEVLMRMVEKSSFDIGELLYEVRSKKYYNDWGFGSFKDYVEKGLGYKQSKAYYLTRIIEVMQYLGIPRPEYEPLGVLKLREIASLNMNETHDGKPVADIIRELVKEGKALTQAEIKQKVKEVKGLVGENEIVWVHFGITESSKQNIVGPAIDLAKANIGTIGMDDEGKAIDASDGRALEVICVEYLNDPQNKPAIMQEFPEEE